MNSPTEKQLNEPWETLKEKKGKATDTIFHLTVEKIH
jgi:hypothetical protein